MARRAVTIDAIVTTGASRTRDAPAVVTPERTLTWKELDAACAVFAASLRDRGVRRGDEVLVVAPNGVGAIVATLGSIRRGALAVPLDPHLRSEQLAVILEAGHPAAAFVDGPIDDVLSDGVPVLLGTADLEGASDDAPVERDDDADRPVTVHYTSGSTGAPKGVLHTHRTWLAGAAFTRDHLALDSESRLLVPLPLHHGYAFRHLLAGLLAGATTLVTSGLLDALERLESLRPDVLLLVPASAAILLERFEPMARRAAGFVRHVSIGTASIGDALLQHTREVFDNAVIHLPYGLSECRVGFLELDDPPMRRRLTKICPGLEVSVVDDVGHEVQPGEAGEILLRGAGVMIGYTNETPVCRAARVSSGFRTGDRGLRMQDGSIALAGRVDDVVKVAGRKVDPLEVEAVLERHPRVRASLVRLADDTEVQLEALIVSSDPSRSDRALTDVLTAHCKGSLEAYKVPARFEIVTDLPRNAIGKIIRTPGNSPTDP